MTSEHEPLLTALSTEARAGAGAGVEEVLDAALAQFEDVGIRRSTIEDIARRAGIDRVTVYRRVGSKDNVTQTVIAREVQRLIAEVMAAGGSLPTFEERLAVAFATAVQHVRNNTLYNRVVALEPETVLPHLTTDAGGLLSIGAAATASLIAQAQEDGILGEISDPQAVAEILARIVHSFALTPHGLLALRTDKQLEAFAREHLTPIVTRKSPTTETGP